ncbi:putative ABC transport system permease protein [Ruminiclostridium sufflavum DSM 19573]|uniref:Putative ABC transport system permease protein n=1 Tax=Ruminiclostridium sufflavum DSM 19573 TaxID=1121337 RepID=A0A318XNX6_9FIRM|nr:ABC transporter permease [Ruminiclostridium sufflavum]PYG87778.1 putative ABC transport system permease protein [Ruminiclostridium sufflavum DSM 19573]
MKNYAALTTKYLKKHRGRTALTLLGVITAIAMFTCIGSIYYSGINSEIERVKDTTGNYEVVFCQTNKEKINILSGNAEIKKGAAVKNEGVLQIDNSMLTESLKEVTIKAYDNTAFKDIFRIKIVDGRLPESGSEIIVDQKFYAILKDKKLDNILIGKLKAMEGEEAQVKYTIVGSFESNEITNFAISYLDMDTSKDSNDYYYFANLKQEKGKMAVAQKIAKANNIKLDGNQKLLYLIGEGPDEEKNAGMEKIFGLIAGFVVLCTVVVIYNAFNISVMERIKHFGILRSIGATKSQIRRLVFKEAAIMSLIAVPIGILAGFAGIMLTFNFLMEDFLGAFEIGFYPQVIIIAGLLGTATVFISAFFPARTASKVSPIDAIRGTMVIRGDKIKKRSGLWAKLIFRFEGQVAYKNIKRSRKRFYVTCLSLMLSLIMFVFFSNFIDVLVQSTKISTQSVKIEGAFIQKDTGGPYLTEKLAKEVTGYEGIKEVFKAKISEIPYPIEKNKVNDSFAVSVKKLKTTKEYKDKYIIGSTKIVGYDENTLKLLADENKLKIDYESFNKNNEVIIFHKAGGLDENNNRFYDGFTKYKTGDVIELPVVDEKYMNNPEPEQMEKFMESGKTIKFKVAGIVDYEIINNSLVYDSYGIIMSSENCKKLTGTDGLSAVAINFTSSDYSGKYYEKFNILADENKAVYYDVYTLKKQSDELQQQLMVLIYGFIGLIILISTVNIINTVTINLLVKKREYATFKAIGMTKGQFKKLVLLEGALFGIIACAIGLPIAFMLTYFGIVSNNPLGDIGYKAAVWPYMTGGAGIIMITLLAALFPLRKLNDMNIVEALRLEE